MSRRRLEKMTMDDQKDIQEESTATRPGGETREHQYPTIVEDDEVVDQDVAETDTSWFHRVSRRNLVHSSSSRRQQQQQEQKSLSSVVTTETEEVDRAVPIITTTPATTSTSTPEEQDHPRRKSILRNQGREESPNARRSSGVRFGGAAAAASAPGTACMAPRSAAAVVAAKIAAMDEESLDEAFSLDCCNTEEEKTEETETTSSNNRPWGRFTSLRSISTGLSNRTGQTAMSRRSAAELSATIASNSRRPSTMSQSTGSGGGGDAASRRRSTGSVTPSRRGSSNTQNVRVMERSFDDAGHAMTQDEQVQFRRERGRCIRCGEVKTHRKVKYGPFKLFRRMEPLTIRNRAYKGYCLICYDMEDIQKELGNTHSVSTRSMNSNRSDEIIDAEISFADPNVERQRQEMERQDNDDDDNSDLPSSSQAPPESAMHPMQDDDDDDDSSKDEWYFSKNGNPMQSCMQNWKAQICVVTVVLFIFGAVIAISIIAFNRQGDDLRDGLRLRTVSPAPSVHPTSAPTQFMWLLHGGEIRPPKDEIAQSGDGFGSRVVLSHSGSRVAVSAPGFNQSTGWVSVFEYALRPPGWDVNNNTREDNVFEDESNLEGIWLRIAGPIVGDAPGDAVGMNIHLSADGTTLAVSFPGNGKGYVRLYRYKINEETGEDYWKQIGRDIIGRKAGEGFGFSLATTREGNSVVIGSPYYSTGSHEECGRVVGYDLVQSQWVQLGPSIAGRHSGSHLGYSLCMADDGRLFVAGAPFDSSRFVESGGLYSFIFGPDAEDMLTEVGVDKTDINVTKESYQQLLTAVSGDSSFDHFGTVLACDADAKSVVSSAIAEDEVRLYTVGGTRWIRSAYITPDDSRGRGTGYSIDISPQKEVIATATKNSQDTTGMVFVVIPVGFKAYDMGQVLGGDEQLGEHEWIREGPSISLGEEGTTVAIGYESILGDEDGESYSVVRIYTYGPSSSSWV